MKVLVTGSEGFIGRNLINYLNKCDVDVIGFDTKSHDVDKIILT